MKLKEWAITIGVLLLSPVLILFALGMAVWSNLTHTEVQTNCGCMSCHAAEKVRRRDSLIRDLMGDMKGGCKRGSQNR